MTNREIWDEATGYRPHTCHAPDCSTEVPPTMFMCRGHWFKLPISLRRAVMRNYRPGQCDDMKPSREYLTAALKAREFFKTQGESK